MTAAEAGMNGRTDEEQLRFAAAEGRVLYSFNSGDYLAIHTAWMGAGIHHAGIAIGKQRYTVREQLRRLIHLCTALDAATMRDRVEFLSAW